MTLPTRHPMRITITVSHALYDYLGQRSQEEGRSMSNLAAFILENTVEEAPLTRGQVASWQRDKPFGRP
jgi:hypothetical protein